MPISQQIGASSLLKPGVVDSASARPATPYEGQVIFQKDTDQLLVWNGTAWVMPNKPAQNPDGLELVKVQTIGSSVTTVVVSDVFSTTYDNYKVIISGGIASGVTLVSLYMGTTLPSATNYYSTRIINLLNAATPSGNVQNGTNQWAYAGQASTTYINLNVEIVNPFINKNTLYSGAYNLSNGAASEFGISQGYLNDITSYTGFSILGGVTLTGGTISVYGYRK